MLARAGALLGGLYGVTRRTAASITFTVEYIRSIPNNDVVSPDGYSYDAYEWNGNGVLEFEDTEVIEFGNENPPPATRPIEEESLDLDNMPTGVSVFLVGILGILGGGSVVLRNPAAGIMWGISFLLLIAAGLFGIGLELFWIGLMVTTILLIIGLTVRLQ